MKEEVDNHGGEIASLLATPLESKEVNLRPLGIYGSAGQSALYSGRETFRVPEDEGQISLEEKQIPMSQNKQMPLLCYPKEVWKLLDIKISGNKIMKNI